MKVIIEIEDCMDGYGTSIRVKNEGFDAGSDREKKYTWHIIGILKDVVIPRVTEILDGKIAASGGPLENQ